ncbi:MAG: endonuclease/exonuclease/phosphatase family protein, partial [Dokdonella sp.]|nr:endonuclease/exonuclease/phosphatase family protein [Dokdonella sp.]
MVFAFAVVALVGGQWPALDFYGQLQAQAGLATGVVCLIALSTQRFWSLTFGLVCVLALAVNLQPHLALPARVEPPARAVAPLRIVWANLRNWSTGPEALTKVLDTETPDIAILTELTVHHQPAVRAATAYAFRTSFPAGSAFDVLLMSRTQPADVRFDYTFGSDYPVLEARYCSFAAAGQCLTLVALHAPRPPLPGGMVGEPAKRRDGLLGLAATIARRRVQAGDQVILLGDFNATPYSTAFREVERASGLADSAQAPAEHPVRPRPTWFSTWPGIG